MRYVRSIGLAAVALFLLASCGELPTVTPPDGDPVASVQAEEFCPEEGACLLPPIASDPVTPDPGCSWCYSGPCETSFIPGSPETIVSEGCNSGGTTSPGDGGSGGSGGTGTLPGADPYAEGPLAWIGCIGAGLAFIGTAVLTYLQLEQYYVATRNYGVAILQYEYAVRNGLYDTYVWKNAMDQAREALNDQTKGLAAYSGVTVGTLAMVAAACSPSVLFPTP